MKILKNEKYVGDVLQGKTFTIDPISHKRLTNYGEADQYYMRNHHEPIIKREDFEKVQEIIKNRVGARATGRRLGNIHYKEDAWYLVFDPIVFDENINSQSVKQTNPKWKTVPLKDKWLKIRIKYRGDQLAIITALNTIYRLTSS